MLAKRNVVFEGAQAALLDRTFGFRPYVTKTACSMKQALQLLEDVQVPCSVTKIGAYCTPAHVSLK